jgi:hypothetical protein
MHPQEIIPNPTWRPLTPLWCIAANQSASREAVHTPSPCFQISSQQHPSPSVASSGGKQ